ncbi:stage III sporulation protein AF [Paenibacillus senegalimassiliensis]|uniref:stage III sporulation protein AF n=1 Tax=Paenibacillus senegalimassiliensis TaxID=1737426 RepID=UPI00073F3A1F|nr:stage III sporulation protein AF [Paenibacillus senegalimassiliensis]
MNWLAEWLREIISIVLIAVFIELLLPNRAMERYVRFVVSLLILLTLLSPVIKLFSADAAQQLEAAFSQGMDGLEDQQIGESTEVILKQGEKLKQKREEEALVWAGEEAARQMKDQIERETGRSVDRVSVKLITESGAKDASSPQPSIASVEVVMSQILPDQQEEQRADRRPTQVAIAPVPKIHIEIDQKAETGVDAPEDSRAAIAGTSTEEAEEEASSGTAGNSGHQLTRQIEQLLRQQWGVGEETITIIDPQA